MAEENPLWGAPRIHGELLKLGIQIGEATVSKYLRERKPPSQRWKTFLRNHAEEIVSVDFFTVPTLGYRVLYVFLMVHNASRRIVHFNVTTNPAPEWAALQVLQAFPWDTAPKFLLRDRDSIYAIPFTSQGEAMGIEQVVTAVRSPWQNSYIERLIGTVRRECLDHVIVLGERHLSRILRQYIEYYPSIHTSCHFDPQAPWQERIPPRRNALGHVCGYQQRRRVARCSI